MNTNTDWKSLALSVGAGLVLGYFAAGIVMDKLGELGDDDDMNDDDDDTGIIIENG